MLTREFEMYIVAVTGASGSIIGIRLIEELLKQNKKVSVVVSQQGWKTLNFELFRDRNEFNSISRVLEERNFKFDPGHLKEYHDNDFMSPIASGTSKFNAIIAAPTSMKTLSCIANGMADSLINRAADVALKENRKCILVTRESPLGMVHLENMLRAKRAGADIVPPMPAFYNFPETIDDVVDFTVGKVLNLLEIEHGLFREWGSDFNSVK